MSGRTTSTASRDLSTRDDLRAIDVMAENQREKYTKLLPSHISFEDFRNAFMVAIQRNARLLEADRASFWLALQRAAGMGLLPDGREGALVIMGDDGEDAEGNPVPSTAKKKKIVQWFPMIRGMIQLVRNTGIVAGLRARLVYRGEDFELLDEDGKIHYKHRQTIDPNFEDTPDNIIGAYAVVQYKDGTWEMVWMSRRQIDRRRAVSRAKNGPWAPWYDEMARKTVLHHLIRGLPQSADLKDLNKALTDDLTIEGEAEPAPPERRDAPPRQIDRAGPPIDIGLNEGRDAAYADRQEDDRQQGTQERQQAATAPKEQAPRQEPKQAQAVTEPKRTAPAFVPVTQPGAATSPPTFDYFATDEIGEPLDPKGDGEFVRFTDPQAFVQWFETRMEFTTDPANLRENNIDAIGDAGRDPKLMDRMIFAASVADTRLRNAAAVANLANAVQDAPDAVIVQEEQQHVPVVMPLEVPMTPGGKPHWPNYSAAAKKEIDAIADTAGLIEWARVNLPTYEGKAIAAQIERHLRERDNALSPPASEQDASDSPEPVDHDSKWAADAIAEIKAAKQWANSDNSVMTWVNRQITKTVMARLQNERPELFKLVDDAVLKKRTDLNA